jgi:hypothetical protein
MIFGSKSGRIGSFGKAASSGAFNPATPAAATPALAAVAAPAPTLDWKDHVETLAEHMGLSTIQAKAARASAKIRFEGRLWTLERTGYFDNKLLMRAQLDIEIAPLPALHLLGLFSAAAILARQFNCAVWRDDADGTLQLSWHVGDLARLTAQEVIAAFEEAKEVVETVQPALVTGLATDPRAVPTNSIA